MDVERIQKINALAVDLMRQGLAQDREDAVAQAERTFRSHDSDDYHQIRETMTSVEENKKPQLNNTELSQEDIKQILEKNTSFLVSKIREFQDKIVSLENEMATLKNKVIFQQRPVQEAPSKQQEQAKSEPHPRTGNFKDTEVSIEKYFYMGKK